MYQLTHSKGRELDVFLAAPQALVFDDLGLVETIDCLGEGIIVTAPLPTEVSMPASAKRSVYPHDQRG